jgi:hypothetical protein
LAKRVSSYLESAESKLRAAEFERATQTARADGRHKRPNDSANRAGAAQATAAIRTGSGHDCGLAVVA